MGLDMYLYASVTPRYSEQSEFQTLMNRTAQVVRSDYGLPESQEWNITLELEVAYWRKANAIHKWFVDHVQDGVDNCEKYYLEHSQIKDLVEACRAVLNDNSLAADLLPPTEGFFFGGTELDEWYFSALEYTVVQLGPIADLKEPSIYLSFYYQSSW